MLTQPLTDLDYLKSLLSKHSIQPSRAMGQNFLISPEVVEATRLAAEEGPRMVTELGAGVGTLTQALVESGYTVRAIEKDRELAALIPKQVSAKNRAWLTVETADLKTTPWEWQKAYQVVGNVPYNLSGLIFRRLTQLEPTPTQAIFLVQKEVGGRVRAGVPNMSLLAAAVQLWGRAERLLSVPRNCFWPQPNVDSELMLLTPSPQALPGSERERVLAIAKIFFQTKRKQMGGVLRHHWNLDQARAEEMLQTVGLQPTQRPQELTPANWIQLAKLLSPA